MRKGTKQRLFGLIVGGFGLLAAASGATAVPFISGDGTETCTYVSPLLGTGACTVETISAHPRWMSDNGFAADWISYGPTGYLDAGPYAPRDPNNALMRVTETLVLTEESKLNIGVWADDTAEVFIDGQSVFAPNFSQNICADGNIGCEPHELGVVMQVLQAGTHTISFDVFQIGWGTSTGSNPFGLLYTGSIDATGGGGGTGTSISEAASLPLLASGLAVLGLLGMKRRRRA